MISPTGFVKIGASNYTIEDVDSFDEALLGQTNTLEKTIKMLRHQPLQSYKQTLYHEIKHAIIHDSGVSLDSLCDTSKDFEEDLINILVQRELAFFLDNRKLANWILS